VPRVSVIVSAYNSELFLARTLESALRQTFTDLELLVIDDGSTDASAEVVRGIMATDPRVRLIVQENRGLAATHNRAIRETRGEFIAPLDHDDVWHPEKLAEQVALLDERPRAGLALCYTAVIDEHHRCLGWKFGGEANGNVYDEMLVWDMVSGGSVPLIRRTALDAVGPFDETFTCREDWDMWVRLARSSEFATVPRTLVGYTRRAANMSRNYEQMAIEGIRILDKARAADPSFAGSRYRYCVAREYFAMACFCAIDGNIPRAWSYLGRSLAVTPLAVASSLRRWAFVGTLIMQTVLPRALYRNVFGALSKISFELQPGRPFDEI